VPAAAPPALPWDARTRERALASVVHALHLAPEAAADWMQEARLHLLAHRCAIAASFRGNATVNTFLHAVLRNHCVNWLRAQRRTGPSALSLEHVPPRLQRALVAPGPDPLEAAERAAAGRRRDLVFRAAWASLASDDRTLLWEYYVDELPMPRIARRHGCSSDAAYKRAQRLVARLRTLCGVPPPRGRRS
jgi:RNA polymerase sigma factor (sigma-70 family)